MHDIKKGIRIGFGIVATIVFTGATALLFAQALNQFSPGDLVSSSQMNANFTALENRIIALERQVAPIGSIVAWHRDQAGVPAIPEGWVECNGQTISDADSPLVGLIAPNLNGDTSAGAAFSPGTTGYYTMFLRGGTLSGTGQLDEFGQHNHIGGGAAKVLNADGSNDFVWSDNTSVRPGPSSGHEISGGLNVAHLKSMIARGGSETRPVNMSVVWIMRVR